MEPGLPVGRHEHDLRPRLPPVVASAVVEAVWSRGARGLSARSRCSRCFPSFFRRREPPSSCYRLWSWSRRGMAGWARDCLRGAAILFCMWPTELTTANVIRAADLHRAMPACAAHSWSRCIGRARRPFPRPPPGTPGNSALRRSDALQSAVLTSAFDCIMTLDDEGRIVEFNPAAEQTFGLARAAAIGRRLCELVDFPDVHQKEQSGPPAAPIAAAFAKAARPQRNCWRNGKTAACSRSNCRSRRLASTARSSLQPICETSRRGKGWSVSCASMPKRWARHRDARTSFWRCWRMSCAIRWPP